MAIEDDELFDGEEPKAPLPGSPEVEDLFDFSSVEFGARKNAPIAAEGAQEPEIETETETQVAEVEVAASSPVAEPVPISSGLADVMQPLEDFPEGFDPDEDIFNFGELFTAAESHAGDEIVSSADFFGEHTTSTPDPSLPEAEVQPRATERPVGLSPTNAVPAEWATLTASAPSRTGRAALMLMGLGFLFVNAAMIFFAWRASNSFQSTLTNVRTDIARTVQAAYSASGPEGTSSTATTSTTSEPNQQPSPLESYDDLELGLAQEEMAAKQFALARRRLFRLVANVDRVAISEDTLSKAEFLIADCYFLEGKELGEEQR